MPRFGGSQGLPCREAGGLPGHPAGGGNHSPCYLPVLDRIQLPDRSAFHSAGALYSTWAHEAIHSSGHSHWVELLKESPRVLLQVLSDARKAADLICPEKVDGQEISDLEMSLT